MNTSERVKITLVLVGDSDTARWPKPLLPLVPNATSNETKNTRSDEDVSSHAGSTDDNVVTTYHTYAKDGATMKQLVAQIKRAKEDISSIANTIHHSKTDAYFSAHYTVFVACAGENDLSSNISVDAIMQQFQEAARCVFSLSDPPALKQHKGRRDKAKLRSMNQDTNHDANVLSAQRTYYSLIFLGPKVEPWMDKDDLPSRKSYFQLSHRIRSAVDQLRTTIMTDSENGDDSTTGRSIHFVDCLTLFCGETQHCSVVGGGAIAKREYFQSDELHLSPHGYLIWKELVEDIVKDLIT